MESIDIEIGRKLGFKRVGVYHVTLKPGSTSSTPHAESKEKEFVYVVKGEVDAWINGYIYPLKEGHAVGFPCGTGIAHCFINNSKSDVTLVVSGEQTKKDNLCSFPINPELKETCGIWWENPPKQEFGPHNGLPGVVQEKELGKKTLDFICYCPEIKRGTPFSYPGDNETFGEGFRITNKVGLKTLGIWYERLPPGRRSSFPHAHTHEEEFVYVLKGSLKAWVNGEVQELKKDSYIGFPSNTGLAHTLINDSEEEVIYLCIGETQEFTDEKLTYPLNPLREKEGQRKAWLWDNPPQHKWGSDPAKPQADFENHLSLRLCSEEDVEEVLDIFKSSPNYFMKLEGALPDINRASNEILSIPSKVNNKFFKEFLIIEYKGTAIGVLDLHINHPDEKTCYLGLLLIKEDLLGRGLGRKCYELTETYIEKALECTKIRLGISDDNEVSGFWKSMGFESSGSNYQWKGDKKTNLVREFEKPLNRRIKD